MNAMEQLVAQSNDDAKLLSDYFRIKARVEARGLVIRADDDKFRILSKGRGRVMFESEDPEELEAWIDDMSGVV